MIPLKLAIVSVAAVVIQLTLFVEVRIAGVAPELLAMLGVLLAFYAGIERGPILAFAAGLLWDIYLPTPLGVAAVTFAIVAFSVASLEEGLFHDSVAQLTVIVGLGSVASVVGYALVGEVVGQRGLIDVEMLRVAVIVGLINATLTPVLAPVVRWALVEGRR